MHSLHVTLISSSVKSLQILSLPPCPPKVKKSARPDSLDCYTKLFTLENIINLDWDHRFLSHTSQTCKKFDSLRKEYYVVSVINGFLSVGLVSYLVLIYINIISFASLSQVNKAVSLFNKYRRHGHQFDIDLYNNIIQSWVQKVSGMGLGSLIE